VDLFADVLAAGSLVVAGWAGRRHRAPDAHLAKRRDERDTATNIDIEVVNVFDVNDMYSLDVILRNNGAPRRDPRMVVDRAEQFA